MTSLVNTVLSYYKKIWTDVVSIIRLFVINLVTASSLLHGFIVNILNCFVIYFFALFTQQAAVTKSILNGARYTVDFGGAEKP